MRVGESLLLAGIPLLGALSLGLPHSGTGFLRIGVLLAGFVLLLGHVYAFNDLCGWEHDRLNEARSDSCARTLGPRRVGELSWSLLAAAALLAYASGPRVLAMAAFVAGLSFLYSHEKIFLKAVPFASSLVHFSAGTAYYLFGRLMKSPLDAAGLLIGVYFGLLYAAGHLNHEALDHEADLRAGLRTHAVLFGPERVLLAALVLIALSSLYLLSLCRGGWAPRPMLSVAAAAVLAYIGLFLSLRKGGLVPARLRDFRFAYRSLYAVVGASWMLFLCRMQP
ncbi:MAG: UbiA family prenyltransferase [Elusimicrobiota bacterium]|jgi:4-hydroxybenzoate polyprenyltransferase